MYHIQTSLFYNLQKPVRNSSLLQKYYYLFQALDLSILPDRNNGIGRTGHSQHAILQAFIVKHLQQIKSVPQLCTSPGPPPAASTRQPISSIPCEAILRLLP